jgi:uncharacterized protein
MDDTDDTKDKDDTDDTFQYGVVLFNRGDFFACHEVWEEVWLRSTGDEKIFYQGMIQAAVAILHAERGNRRGAASTWHKARAKLETLPAIHRGIVLGEFRDALAEFFTSLLDHRTAHELPPRPKINRYSK